MTQLAIVPPANSHGINFFDNSAFDQALRVANMFAGSALVPTIYQGKPGNCLLALDIANRTGSSALMVMQNLNIIHGKPSWSSQYIIASINSKGSFTPLRYEVTDLGMQDIKGIKVQNKVCVAYAWEVTIPADKRTKENRLESAPISCETAILEGWWSKSGSKWPSMTELMLRYRAATLFGRMYSPETLMGMETQEEAVDIVATPVESADDERKTAAVDSKLATTRKPRSDKKGVSAAAEVVVEAEQTDSEVSDPAAANEATQPAPTTPAAPAEPTPAATPAIPSRQLCRSTVATTTQLELADKRLITKLMLAGEFTGEAFFEKPMAEFAPVNSVIDATIERRAHRTKAGEFLFVVLSFEIVAA